MIGTEAVDLLVTLVRTEEPTDPHRIVPFSLIPRASTQIAGKWRSQRGRRVLGALEPSSHGPPGPSAEST